MRSPRYQEVSHFSDKKVETRSLPGGGGSGGAGYGGFGIRLGDLKLWDTHMKT